MSPNSAPVRLSSANLRELAGDIIIPTYDRGQLRQHTVHMGVGGFHRAHQAVYLDDLLALAAAGIDRLRAAQEEVVAAASGAS